MATYHGKVTNFLIDDAGATERDLSAFVTDCSLDLQQAVADATAKGSAAQVHTVGHYGGTMSVSGRYDDTATTGPDVVMRGLVTAGASTDCTIEWGGGGVGTDETTFSVTITGFTRSSPLAGTIDWSATGTINGAVTETDIT